MKIIHNGTTEVSHCDGYSKGAIVYHYPLPTDRTCLIMCAPLLCAWQWWKGELQRRYTLQRARDLHHFTIPAAAAVQARKPVQALPQVEVVSEAGNTEGHAVLTYVMGELNKDLFTELMKWFHASEDASDLEDDSDSEDGSDMEVEGGSDSEGGV
jgi:hypothetical protein